MSVYERGTEPLPDIQGCDCHDEFVPAVASVIMLDTDSMDALTFVCGPCLIDFWNQWRDDPERAAYEVRPL